MKRVHRSSGLLRNRGAGHKMGNRGAGHKMRNRGAGHKMRNRGAGHKMRNRGAGHKSLQQYAWNSGPLVDGAGGVPAVKESKSR